MNVFWPASATNHEIAQNVIRKTARLATYYNSKWYVLYVQTAERIMDKIALAAQRHLINNFKMPPNLGLK